MGIGRLKLFALSLAAAFAVATNAQSQIYLNGYLLNFEQGSVFIQSGSPQYGTLEVVGAPQVSDNLQPNPVAATLDYSTGGYVVNVPIKDKLVAAPGTTWMPDYYQPKYNEGFNAGYSSGYDTGLTTGKQRGTTEGTSKGHGDGYSAGYGESYQPAYDHAYDAQYPVGNRQGWDTGVHDGLIAGYNYADYLAHVTMSSSSSSINTFYSGVFGSSITMTSGGVGGGRWILGTLDGADYTVWRDHLTDYSDTAYWSSHFYDLGYTDGTSPGTTAGDTDGYNLTYPVAYTAAYKTGHADGLVVGFNEGTSQGGTNGFQTGWSDGNSLGSNQGFTAGYDFYFTGKHDKLQYALDYTRRSSESASASVPEPASILLFSLGGIGLLALCRRRSL